MLRFSSAAAGPDRDPLPAAIAAPTVARERGSFRQLQKTSALAPSPAAKPPLENRPRSSLPRSAHAKPQDVVVVGNGAPARELYFPALLALQQANRLIVRAVVDPTPEGTAAAGATFPDALRVASIDVLPAFPDALAIIASPARQHPAHANAALKRGWHVMCASPLALHAADGALLIAAAQRAERLLAIDLRARFFPTFLFLRTLCEDRLLGPPISFRVDVGPMPPLPSSVPEPEKPEHPDGALAALGGPCLELLTWCFGNAAIVSYADDAMGGVEANAVIELSFGEGVRGTVHLSRDWPVEDNYTFIFERGILRWTGNRVNALTLQLASAPAALAAELVPSLSAVHSHSSPALPASEVHACMTLLENVIAAIAGLEVLQTPATEAMHSLPLIDACYAQRSSLPQPWLPHNEAVHARALTPPGTLRRS